MPHPAARRQRRFFSVRVFLALGIFAMALTAGVMTGFGPDVVLGPPPLEQLDSLVSARDGLTGEPLSAALGPGTIGPGSIFQVTLVIPGGLEGYARINSITIESDHRLWPTRRVAQYDKTRWPDFIPKAKPEPVRVTLRNLLVPSLPELAHAEVVLHVTMTGTRPMLDGIYLVDEPFEREIELICKLGRGDIEPTGMLNFDPYNRMTTGLVALCCLALVSWLMRPDHTPVLDSPEERLARLSKG